MRPFRRVEMFDRAGTAEVIPVVMSRGNHNIRTEASLARAGKHVNL